MICLIEVIIELWHLDGTSEDLIMPMCRNAPFCHRKEPSQSNEITFGKHGKFIYTLATIKSKFPAQPYVYSLTWTVFEIGAWRSQVERPYFPLLVKRKEVNSP